MTTPKKLLSRFKRTYGSFDRLEASVKRGIGDTPEDHEAYGDYVIWRQYVRRTPKAS